jgi:hypothetical protein
MEPSAAMAGAAPALPATGKLHCIAPVAALSARSALALPA